jgi:metal-responsive CopG/Arc/MetJ family transcriptional regulator
MPRTERGKPPGRTSVGLPNPMIAEVDRIVAEHPEMNYTRQQFIESAVREKIERTRLLERPRRS